MSSQPSQPSKRRGRPSLSGRGSKKIEMAVDERKKSLVEKRAAALGISVASYLHMLVDMDIRANPPEVLLEAS